MTDKAKLKECVRLLDSSASNQIVARVGLIGSLATCIIGALIDHYRGNPENGTAYVGLALTGCLIYVWSTWEAATAARKAKQILEKEVEF